MPVGSRSSICCFFAALIGRQAVLRIARAVVVSLASVVGAALDVLDSGATSPATRRLRKASRGSQLFELMLPRCTEVPQPIGCPSGCARPHPLLTEPRRVRGAPNRAAEPTRLSEARDRKRNGPAPPPGAGPATAVRRERAASSMRRQSNSPTVWTRIELVDPAVPGGMPATMMTVSPAWAKCLRWRRSSTCATISSVCRTSGTS